MSRTTAVRTRRTQADIGVIKAAIVAALEEDRPMTVRQVFYRLVSNAVIEKSEAEYKQTVCRLLAEMRWSEEIPFGWIADYARGMRKPLTHGSLAKALEYSARHYRRAMWDNQDVYVEIWLEKDALSGVLREVTSVWDTPLMVCKGYPSLTFLHDAAQAIRHKKKPTFLYYFGDHDPSGCNITKTVERDIRRFAPDAEITFERTAVTPGQIIELDLATRPTKKSDSRSKGFEGESVEVDAIPPKGLKAMVESCITRHIDDDRLAQLRRVEEAERETVKAIARNDWDETVEKFRNDLDNEEAENN